VVHAYHPQHHRGAWQQKEQRAKIGDSEPMLAQRECGAGYSYAAAENQAAPAAKPAAWALIGAMTRRTPGSCRGRDQTICRFHRYLSLKGKDAHEREVYEGWKIRGSPSQQLGCGQISVAPAKVGAS
jgi:hypothetical protein